MDLALALSRFAEATGKSQRELALIAGVDQSTISRAMNGDYGRDGWRAAMTVLGLSRIVRSLDGSYSTPEFKDLVEMLLEQVPEQIKSSGADQVDLVIEIDQLVAKLESGVR